MKKAFYMILMAALISACGSKETKEAETETSASGTEQPNSGADENLDASLIEQPANTASQGRNPEPFFAFSEEEWDFGIIEDGEKVNHTFKFANTGGAPLVISDVSTTCGCTVPNWPKDPIQPGQSSQITVTFDSKGKTGMVTKDINIIANTNPVQKIIRIKAQVSTPNQTP